MENWNPDYHLKNKENIEQSSSTFDSSIHDEPQRAITTLNPTGNLQNSNIQFSPSNRKENIHSTVPNPPKPEEKPPSYETHRGSVPYDETIQFFGDSNATDTKNYPSRTLLDQEGLHRGNISTMPYAGDERRRSSTERRRSSALPTFEPREVTTHTPAKSDIPIGKDALQNDRENISALPINNDSTAPSTHEPSNFSQQDHTSDAREKANERSYTDMASNAMASVTATAAAAAAALFGKQTDFPTPNDTMPGGDMGKTPLGNEGLNDYVSSRVAQQHNNPKSAMAQHVVLDEKPQDLSTQKPTVAQASLEPLVPEENIKPLEEAYGSSARESTVAKDLLEPLAPEENTKPLDNTLSSPSTVAQKILSPKDNKVSEERSAHGPTLAQNVLDSPVKPLMHDGRLDGNETNPSFGTATIFGTSATTTGSHKLTDATGASDVSISHVAKLNTDELGCKETASSRDGGAMGLTSALNQISLSDSDISNTLDSTQGPLLPHTQANPPSSLVGKNHSGHNDSYNHSRSNSSFNSTEKHAVHNSSELSTHGKRSSETHGNNRGINEHSSDAHVPNMETSKSEGLSSGSEGSLDKDGKKKKSRRGSIRRVIDKIFHKHPK